MIGTFLTGIVATVLMAVAWVGVQLAWRSVFAGAFADPDVLAGRGGCRGCKCVEPCERKREEQSGKEIR